MAWLDVAPLITLLGVLATLWVTVRNSQEINKFSRDTSFMVESFKSQTQFRMACIDRRLQAHQEAFGLWSALLKTSADSEFIALHGKCSDWWANNCLYLDPKVQQAFLSSITAGMQHHKMVRSGAGLDQVNEVFNKFTAFPKILFDAIQLPPLTEIELTSITKQPTA